MPDVSEHPRMVELRAEYNDLLAREAEIHARLGAVHDEMDAIAHEHEAVALLDAMPQGKQDQLVKLQTARLAAGSATATVG
jgi:uncharacterized protein involved in exopolysaccharide biosynthesis